MHTLCHLQKLSGHIEAALTSGLSFKDRFTSGPKRPSTLLPSETSVETSGDEETLASTSAGVAWCSLQAVLACLLYLVPHGEESAERSHPVIIDPYGSCNYA